MSGGCGPWRHGLAVRSPPAPPQRRVRGVAGASASTCGPRSTRAQGRWVSLGACVGGAPGGGTPWAAAGVAPEATISPVSDPTGGPGRAAGAWDATIPGTAAGIGPGGPRKRRRCGKRPSDRRSRGLADHAGHPMPAGEPEADVEREAGEGRRRERGPPSGHYTGVAPRITPGIPDVLTPRRRQCRPGRPGCPGTCVWQTTPTSRQEIASVRDIARGGPIARLSVSTRPDRLAAVPVAISPSVQAGGRQPSRSSR